MPPNTSFFDGVAAHFRGVRDAELPADAAGLAIGDWVRNGRDGNRIGVIVSKVVRPRWLWIGPYTELSVQLVDSSTRSWRADEVERMSVERIPGYPEDMELVQLQMMPVRDQALVDLQDRPESFLVEPQA